jgi:hypothetical protein
MWCKWIKQVPWPLLARPWLAWAWLAGLALLGAEIKHTLELSILVVLNYDCSFAGLLSPQNQGPMCKRPIDMRVRGPTSQEAVSLLSPVCSIGSDATKQRTFIQNEHNDQFFDQRSCLNRKEFISVHFSFSSSFCCSHIPFHSLHFTSLHFSSLSLA